MSPGLVVLDGASLTPAAVASVARDGARVELTGDARRRNDAARSALAELLRRGEPIYGATTGVGSLRDYPITEEERGDYSIRLLRSHACGAGRVLSTELVRAAMATRANQI